jgi:hypothetical protein
MKHQALMLALLATLGAVLVAGPGMAEQANALTLKNTGPATADASGGDGGDGQDGGDGADGGTAAAIISQFCRNFCPP